MSTIEKKEGNKQKEKGYEKRKILVWISILILIVAGYFLWCFLQKKAVGTILVRDLDSEESSNKNSEKKLYRGKFVTFSHGAGYVEKFHHLPENGPVQETILLSTPDVEGRKIAVTVTHRGTNDLMEEPAFQLRQGIAAEYHLKNFQEGIWQGVLFTKNTAPFEKTIFFAKSGFIISVSVTSPFSGDEGEEEIFVLVRDLSFSIE